MHPRGDIGYSLKPPYRDGTTLVISDPLDFIGRLAVLVPPPRLRLARPRGIFAANSPYRARITPARRGRRTPENPAKSMLGLERPRTGQPWKSRNIGKFLRETSENPTPIRAFYLLPATSGVGRLAMRCWEGLGTLPTEIAPAGFVQVLAIGS